MAGRSRSATLVGDCIVDNHRTTRRRVWSYADVLWHQVCQRRQHGNRPVIDTVIVLVALSYFAFVVYLVAEIVGAGCGRWVNLDVLIKRNCSISGATGHGCLVKRQHIKSGTG